MPRPEGPFERLLRQRPDRDPAPIIIGGTIAFLAIVIVLVFILSSVIGGGDDDDAAGGGGGDGNRCTEVAAGLEGCLATMPGLPPGLVSESQFVEFETEQNLPAIIGLPLKSQVQDASGLGFYTFIENRWQRLVDVALQDDGKVAQGDFDSVPANLAVLRVVDQTYQVAASIPHDGALHPDANSAQIVNPRDFTPAADGSVQGSATDASRAEGVLLMPTIVGSSADTAAVVNDIIADETLRAQHVQAIRTLVVNAGLDGIDLEYSSVDVELDTQFTTFVQALADALHADQKRLALTLPPPTNQRLAYDLVALGQVADYIKILPIADPVVYWDTMPNALAQVVSQVDPRKVMLVISPFSIEGQGDASRPIGYLQAMVRATEITIREPDDPATIEAGTQVRLVARNLDEGEGASPLRWNDDALTVSFAIGGNERTRIFIENSYSVGFKLELVQAYGLGGLAVSDGSAQSDVTNVWPQVNAFVDSATVNLRRPNDSMLLPIWQAPDGGQLGAGSGTTATWTPDGGGDFNLVLVVSDGDRRFGQQLLVHSEDSEEASPSPLETFAPDTETPTPTATGEPTETPLPGVVLVEVGNLAEGDDDGLTFSNDETVTPGSDVTYLVTIDNDSDVPVSITSLADSVYGDIVCETSGGEEVTGAILAPDDGDGIGVIDGGADEIQCTFIGTAPADSGASVTNVITAVVEDEDGNQDADQDGATITTS